MGLVTKTIHALVYVSLFQSEVRKTYKLLLDDEDNEFSGFDFDPR